MRKQFRARVTRATGAAGAAGFTIVELVVALVILTVGIVAIGVMSGTFNRQVVISDVSVERSAALQASIEEILATPFPDILDGSATIGEYAVSWTVLTSTPEYKEVEIVTVGPGMEGGALLPTVSDTFIYKVLGRPDVQCAGGRVVVLDDDDDDVDNSGPGSQSSDDDDDLDMIDLCEKYYPEDDDDDDADTTKVCVWHIPPGNPGSARQISVSVSAVPAHVSHGDYTITCES